MRFPAANLPTAPSCCKPNAGLIQTQSQWLTEAGASGTRSRLVDSVFDKSQLSQHISPKSKKWNSILKYVILHANLNTKQTPHILRLFITILCLTRLGLCMSCLVLLRSLCLVLCLVLGLILGLIFCLILRRILRHKLRMLRCLLHKHRPSIHSCLSNQNRDIVSK